MRNRSELLKWSIICILTVLTTVVSNMPQFLSIFGVKPILTIPLTVAVFTHETPVKNALYAVFSGFVWDALSLRGNFGGTALFLFFVGVCISYLYIFFIRNSTINYFLTLIGTVILFCFGGFLFGYVMWGHPGILEYFLRYTVPTAIYTVLVGVLFYPLIVNINRLFKEMKL